MTGRWLTPSCFRTAQERRSFYAFVFKGLLCCSYYVLVTLSLTPHIPLGVSSFTKFTLYFSTACTECASKEHFEYHKIYQIFYTFQLKGHSSAFIVFFSLPHSTDTVHSHSETTKLPFRFWYLEFFASSFPFIDLWAFPLKPDLGFGVLFHSLVCNLFLIILDCDLTQIAFPRSLWCALPSSIYHFHPQWDTCMKAIWKNT